ncbi:alpha/beta fold hydrolase [Williamsia sp. 1135]|uniref:alpha/beta hydrolase n=1 Tax=Williamsia sp. 1135 TaxID=1889262 RepID=UPI000A1171A6|nr:alpha/beta fold hydrolase [Williamsia sp. 1135]ORM37384.1 hypothetical protein BFL43_04295 [Williamsia sp. 1135]
MESNASSAEALVTALADVWEASGLSAIRNEADLIDALRDLDAALLGAEGEDIDAAHNRVLAVLDESPDFADKVADAQMLRHLGEERGIGNAQSTPVRLGWLQVLYATDRSIREGDDLDFGGDRGRALRFGVAKIGLPDHHESRERPRMRRRPLGFGRSRKPVITLTPTENLREKVSELAGELPPPNGDEQGQGLEVLLFVHGYNVTFADAVRQVARMAEAYDFKGIAAVYSWPSAGNLNSYVVDSTSVEASQRYFRRFVQILGDALPEGTPVHIVAHSMGNRLVTEALAAGVPLTLGHVIFAAPDVDAEVFAHRSESFPREANRYTLYVSRNDRALGASQSIAGWARAGNSVVVVDGVDTIDATEVESDFLGHSYVFQTLTVVSDIYHLIRNNLGPDDRFGLLPQTTETAQRFWVMRHAAGLR